MSANQMQPGNTTALANRVYQVLYEYEQRCNGHRIDSEGPKLADLLVTEKGMALEAIMQSFARELSLLERAYGGCRVCYGKGYATVNDHWRGVDTDQDVGSPGGVVQGGNDFKIKYCSCDRGAQLSRLTQRSPSAGTADVNNLHKNAQNLHIEYLESQVKVLRDFAAVVKELTEEGEQ